MHHTDTLDYLAQSQEEPCVAGDIAQYDGAEWKCVSLQDLSDSMNTKRVFLSSVKIVGDIGSLAAADAICQERASFAGDGLGGIWKGVRVTPFSYPY